MISKEHRIKVEVEVMKYPRYFVNHKPWFSHKIPHTIITELLGTPDKNFDGKEFWWVSINGQDISIEKMATKEGEPEKVMVWADEKHTAYDYFGMIVYSAFGQISVNK